VKVRAVRVGRDADARRRTDAERVVRVAVIRAGREIRLGSPSVADLPLDLGGVDGSRRNDDDAVVLKD
jgi:hypothetical protein